MSEAHINFTLISRIGYLVKLYDFVILPKNAIEDEDLELLREYFSIRLKITNETTCIIIEELSNEEKKRKNKES